MAQFKPGESGNPAGKPKGSLSRRSQMAYDTLLTHGLDPIEALCKLYKALDRKTTAGAVKDRIQILTSLLPYCYPKLSTLSIWSEADRAELEAEIERELARLVALEQPH